MKPGRILAGTAATLALAWGVAAQQTSPAPIGPAEEPPKVQYTARVLVPEAEARCKPSLKPQFYATNKLRQHETVQVVEKLPDGWLAILPPPGSFSFINMRFLKSDNDVTWRVVTDPDTPVQVRCGSTVKKDQPTVISAEVKRGTQVVSVGKPIAADDGLWLPIEPPVRELRYIRAESVEPVNVTGQTSPPPLAQPAGGGAVIPATTTALTSARAGLAIPGPGGVSHPLWQQAQQAEQQGNWTEAIRLYDELGRSVRASDHDLAMKAHLQAQDLRNRGRSFAPPPGGYSPPAPAANQRLQPVPSHLQASVKQPACVPCQSTSSSFGGNYRSLPGRLVQSTRQLEGPTYALEDGQGRLLMYVTPQSGVDLKPYLYRYIEVIGPLAYRGDLRTYHMRATQVVTIQ